MCMAFQSKSLENLSKSQNFKSLLICMIQMSSNTIQTKDELVFFTAISNIKLRVRDAIVFLEKNNPVYFTKIAHSD